MFFFAFYYLVPDENNTHENIHITPASPQQRPILNVVDENSSRIEYQNSNNNNNNKDISSSSSIDEARTNISSSNGPATSTSSPSSPRHYKPVSLTSTQTYFKTIQRQLPQHGSSPILQLRTIIHNDDDYDDKESVTISTRPRTSSMKNGERKDMIATVRFIGDTSDEHGTNIEETYL